MASDTRRPAGARWLCRLEWRSTARAVESLVADHISPARSDSTVISGCAFSSCSPGASRLPDTDCSARLSCTIMAHLVL